jgi:hypothetical protein
VSGTTSVRQPESAEAGRWGTRLSAAGPTSNWGRAGVIVAILALAFVAAHTCQKSSIRLNKDQAIAKAKRQVDFAPKRTQIRLLRQGLSSKPFWIVSLSTPGKRAGTFHDLAVVRINANTGKVATVTEPVGQAKQ